MDKNAIKKYAVWARRELIERVSQRAMIYGITAKDASDPNAESVNGHLLSQAEKRQRQALIRNIKTKGYEQVMEEVAYTWFNRFAALRFMEVNGYLPSHIRVFTNDTGEFKPQILAEAIHLELDGLDMNKVYGLESANKSEELFKYLLIVQCNALNSILPRMFQRIEDYTELLLPDYLLREGSVIEQMVTTIPEEDWTDQVQIIGWLYQYYNTEPKDKVFADLKKNIKITKENIPAATQLFTPDWIVHYMVENSLGRLWLEGHPNDALKSEWKYYLDEAEQEPEVQAQLATIRKEYAALKPEEIRVIDPCMGSGHILCVLFDVLVRIYEDYGYTAREAAVKIVENNLWGLDIDERAAQLSYFAVMMQARQYDRRFFARKVQPHVYPIVESNGVDQHALEYFGNNDEQLFMLMRAIINDLHDAKEYGSLLTVGRQDWTALYERFDQIQDSISMLRDQALAMKSMVQVAEALSQRYHITITNPPYLALGNSSSKIRDLVNKQYPEGKSDLFAAFLLHAQSQTIKNGFISFVTSYTWMFLDSYEKMRVRLLQNCGLTSLVQPEYHSFFEEANVPLCTYVLRNSAIKERGEYVRLQEFYGASEQEPRYLYAASHQECAYRYSVSQTVFEQIPGTSLAYWLKPALYTLFNNEKKIRAFGEPKKGLSTGENNRFLRLWTEVDITKCGFGLKEYKEPYKWIPLNKGGEYRKWYGNNTYLINWEHNGSEVKAFSGSVIRNERFYFRKSLTWTMLSSACLGIRASEQGKIFEGAGPSLFVEEEYYNYILGLLCSKLGLMIINVFNPTMNININDIGNIPIVISDRNKEEIDSIVVDSISLSKEDWDCFETSWDFLRHPLVNPAINHDYMLLLDCWKEWECACEERFGLLKDNEERLNRIFIHIYSLQDELTPEVEDKDVTVRRADLGRDIRSFISYAVGCMFGRYSLDTSGLVYAGGMWDDSKYATFHPDKDAIIPICDDEYFEDDIVGRFVKFVEVVYGKETLEENLRFIADALGGKGSSREVIRNYFINDFYADHLKVYQKRPIYWLFDSGKKNGFKCLIYMHRYQPDTIARIRTDYVHEQQSRYRTAIADLEQRINSASTSERVKLSKQLTTLQAQAEEIRVYEEKIHHLADQMIKIDLDDGVKHNYEIFKDVLAKIK